MEERTPFLMGRYIIYMTAKVVILAMKMHPGQVTQLLLHVSYVTLWVIPVSVHWSIIIKR